MKELEKLLETATFGSWNWRICELPDDNDPEIPRHSVLMEHPVMAETVNLEFDPIKPAESFLEALAGLYDDTLSGTEEEAVLWHLFAACCEAAETLGCPVPGRKVTVSMRLIRTAEKEIRVTEAEYENIREEGCIPNPVWLEMESFTDVSGEYSADCSVWDGNEPVKDWDYVPQTRVWEGGDQ